VGEDWARPVVHFQIVARDLEKQAEFYGRMFNWDAGVDGLRPFGFGLGGPEPGPGGHFRPGDQSHVVLYVQVRDIHASLELAAELGGKVIAEPVLKRGVTGAFIEDPEGNSIGLIQQ